MQCTSNAAAIAAPGAIDCAPARSPRVGHAGRRLLKHPRFMPYFRLIALVVLINVAVLVHHLDRGDWLIADGSALSALATLTLLNFTAAVVIRQQHVLNVLYGLAGRGSPTWPLWIRWSRVEGEPVGGIHAGGALAGTAWLCAFTCVATIAHVREPAAVSVTTLVLAYCLAALALRGRGLRDAGGEEPCAQRVRDHAPLRRLDRGGGVLGADRPARSGPARRRRPRSAPSLRAGRSGCSRWSRRASPRRGCACAACR